MDLLNLQICNPGRDSLLGGGWLLAFESFVPFVCLASCPKQCTKDFRREHPKRSEAQTYATKPEAGRGSFCVITGCTPKTLSRTVMITKPSTCAFSNFWAIRVWIISRAGCTSRDNAPGRWKTCQGCVLWSRDPGATPCEITFPHMMPWPWAKPEIFFGIEPTIFGNLAWDLLNLQICKPGPRGLT